MQRPDERQDAVWGLLFPKHKAPPRSLKAKGGHARMAQMDAKERSEFARKGAQKRWWKHYEHA